MTPKDVAIKLENKLKEWGVDNIKHNFFQVSRHMDASFTIDAYKLLKGLDYFIKDRDYWFEVRFYDGINKKMVMGNYLHYYDGNILRVIQELPPDVVISKKFQFFESNFTVEFNDLDVDHAIPTSISDNVETLKKLSKLKLLTKKI